MSLTDWFLDKEIMGLSRLICKCILVSGILTFKSRSRFSEKQDVGGLWTLDSKCQDSCSAILRAISWLLLELR